MPNLITTDAELECTQGTIKTKLTVTSQNFLCIENKPIATEADKQPNVNIKPFGQCKLKPVSGGYLPCSPITENWQNTTKKNELNGNKMLLEISVCPCTSGGILSVTHKGHREQHISE